MQAIDNPGSGTRPPLVVAAGRLFHGEVLACPESADMAQRRQMAELALEERSPLPIEQLTLSITGRGPRSTLWVAVRKRLPDMADAPDDAPAHRLPEPALPLPPNPGFAGWRWLTAAPDSLTALRYEAGSDTPVELRGFAVTESLPAEILRATQASRLPGTHEPGIWHLITATPARTGGLDFVWEHRIPDTEPTRVATHLDAVALDAADLRDPEVVARLRADHALRRRLGSATRILAFGAGAVLLLQFVIWGYAFAGWRLDSRLAATRADADRAEATATLLGTLDRVTANRLPALERLAAVNQLRPDGVTLTSAAFAENTVRVAGRAASMGELNSWIGALRKSPAFSAVTTSRVNTAADGARFELQLTAAPGGAR